MQDKYNNSETNKKYRYPFEKDLESDSEQSIQSLEFVLYYDLKKQNDDKPIDENDQLVELLYSIGKMEKDAIREEIEYLIVNILEIRDQNYLICYLQ